MSARAGLFLDLDRTLATVAVEPFYLRELVRSGQAGAAALVPIAWAFGLHALGLLRDPCRVKRRVAHSLLRGQPVQPHLDGARRLIGARNVDLLRPGILDLVQEFRRAGHPVFLVSAALDFLVEPFAQLIEADGWFGTETLRADGRFTGELGPLIPFLEAKAVVLRRMAEAHGLDLAASTACSDSELDLPMLRAVGRPIAVAPSRKLARLAAAYGWPVLG